MTDHEHRRPEELGGALRERLMEGMEGFREGMNTLFPPEFRSHVRSARREFWLAVRSLVDARIEALEHEGRQRQSGQSPRGPVNLE